MKTVPLHLKAARQFIRQYHRHSLPPVGGKFAIGAEDAGKLVGVAVCGRPVARHLDDGKTLEVLRVCTDSTKNANSFLYAAARRVAAAMGYQRVISYTLQEESGASLRAVGASPVAEVRAAEWTRPSRPRGTQPVYGQDKVRWEL